MSFLSEFFKRSHAAPSCSAVIVAAGASTRMEGGDKLLAEINGLPVLLHTLMAFEKNKAVDEIVVVARADDLQKIGDLCRSCGINKASKIMAGGKTRLESVYNGAFAVSEGASYIAIHDGARPCIEQAVIERALAAAAKYHAAAPALPVRPTLKRVKGGIITETVDREGLYEIQTPQIFSADMIKAALTNARKKSLDVTDDCMAAELIGFPVHITEGSVFNIKITTKDDLMVAEAIRNVIAVTDAR